MILTDTGFWCALLNKNDRHHTVANKVLNELEEPLICTWPVVTEATHLLLSRLGAPAMVKFIDSLEKRHFEVFDLSVNHYPRIKVLMKKYISLPMDLADASLIILAEELNHGKILSTDKRDFNAYRWKNRKPFTNLLLG